jgi:hypothetical protein
MYSYLCCKLPFVPLVICQGGEEQDDMVVIFLVFLSNVIVLVLIYIPKNSV